MGGAGGGGGDGSKLIDGVVYKRGAGRFSMNNTSCMHSWQPNSQPKLYAEPDAGKDGWVNIFTNCSHHLRATNSQVSMASMGKES